MHRSARLNLTRSVVMSFVCISAFMTVSLSAQQRFGQSIDTFFNAIHQDFSSIADASILRTSKISPVNAYFVKKLRANQVVYSLVRTNSKGVVINEVIRGETPLAKRRIVSDQAWFGPVSKRMQEHTGIVKEETGRYYLFWVAPIKSSNGRFLGGLAAKIDLWDCIHKFSASTEIPFALRLGNKTLYSHKWNDTITYTEEPVTVPGVDKISVRYPTAAQGPSAEQLAAQQKARQDSLRAKAMLDSLEAVSVKRVQLRNRVIIACSIGVFALLIFVIVRIVLWIRHRELIRRIEEE